MKFRYLRIAVTALSLTASVLLIALWVRSFTTLDTVFWPWTDHALALSSLKGHVVLSIIGKAPAEQWTPFRVEHIVIGDRFKTRFNNNVFGFYFARKPGGFRLDLPHWLLVLLGMTIAVAAWRHKKWRFSLRTLLIATTLVAVGIGVVVAAQ
jgi:hypothetical protein